MENTYGIGVANRYALFLDDESDPLEAIKQKEQEREAKKKSKVAEKENTKGKQEIQPKGKTAPVPKKVKEISNKPQEKRDESKPITQKPSNEGKPERPFEKKNNENREAVNNRRNRDDNRTFAGNNDRGEFRKDREDRIRKDNNSGENNFENRPRGERGDREQRGGGVDRERGDRDRGDRNREDRNRERNLNNKPGEPRGPRRPFTDRRGKREFDRQSGSDKTHGYRGVKHIDKRDGSGPHNWGSNKDVIEEADNKPAEPVDNWGIDPEPVSAPVEQKEEPTEPEVPQPEEPKELTLDEWKAQRAGRAKPTYNIRKAGEGEDPSQWKKMYELRKKENEEESDDEEYDFNEYPQRVGRQKHILDIDIQFNDPRRPGQGRGKGPRSGPRGGQAGGGNKPNTRGERPERRFRDEQGEEKPDNRRAPKVDDERDFPSLG